MGFCDLIIATWQSLLEVERATVYYGCESAEHGNMLNGLFAAIMFVLGFVALCGSEAI